VKFPVQTHTLKTVCFFFIAITLHNLSCFCVDEVVHLRGKSVNAFVGGVVHPHGMYSTMNQIWQWVEIARSPHQNHTTQVRPERNGERFNGRVKL
jgi:hypothetical protein